MTEPVALKDVLHPGDFATEPASPALNEPYVIRSLAMPIAQAAAAAAAAAQADAGSATMEAAGALAAAQGAAADAAIAFSATAAHANRTDNPHATTAAQVGACASNDSRLSNARTPTAHGSTHVGGTDPIANATSVAAGLMAAADKSKLDGLPASAVASSDARLSDARTPTAHAASHVSGADQIGTVSASARGLAPVSPGGTGAFLRADSTWAVPAPAPATARSRNTADVPNATTTLANVTGLQATLLANTVYGFRCSFDYTTSAATVGLQLAMAFSGTATAIRYGVTMGTSATAMNNARAAAINTKVGPTNVGPGATARTGTLEGVIRVGASGGTLNVQLAAGVAGTATVLADALLEVSAL